MQKLVQGIHHFQANIFRSQRELFERLAVGQQPEALFITCSDSRINPNLITQTDPGELFILRNAGNIVPPSGAAGGGEAATIEFAVLALGVKDIIVCGHSHCGAMSALLQSERLAELPALAAWLSHAEATRRIMKEKYHHLSGPPLVTATVEENVIVQLENLRTHPAAARRTGTGRPKVARLGLQDRKRRGVRVRPRTRPVRPSGRAHRCRDPGIGATDGGPYNLTWQRAT